MVNILKKNIMKDFAAIDFETANNNRSSICSVGVVIVRNGLIVDRLYSLIRPTPNFYSHYCVAVHGITSCDTEFAPEFIEVWSEISSKIEGLPLVAHNSAFDEGCLKSIYAVSGIPYPNYEIHCTLKASRNIFKELPNHKLCTVSSHCGFTLTNHHNAIADAEDCAHIAIKLNWRLG